MSAANRMWEAVYPALMKCNGGVLGNLDDKVVLDIICIPDPSNENTSDIMVSKISAAQDDLIDDNFRGEEAIKYLVDFLEKNHDAFFVIVVPGTSEKKIIVFKEMDVDDYRSGTLTLAKWNDVIKDGHRRMMIGY